MRVDFRLTGSVLSDFRNSSDGNELFWVLFCWWSQSILYEGLLKLKLCTEIHWVPEERVTLFTPDGLVQIGGSIVPRRISSSDVWPLHIQPHCSFSVKTGNYSVFCIVIYKLLQSGLCSDQMDVLLTEKTREIKDFPKIPTVSREWLHGSKTEHMSWCSIWYCSYQCEPIWTVLYWVKALTSFLYDLSYALLILFRDLTWEEDFVSLAFAVQLRC